MSKTGAAAMRVRPQRQPFVCVVLATPSAIFHTLDLDRRISIPTNFRANDEALLDSCRRHRGSMDGISRHAGLRRMPKWPSGFLDFRNSGSGDWLAGVVIGKIGWYANVPLLLGAGLLAFGKVRLWMALLAIFLATSAFQTIQPPPIAGPVCAHGIGFWLWFASFVVLLAAAAWGRLVRNEQDPQFRFP